MSSTDSHSVSAVKEIVIVGGSYAGFASLHSILRHVIPSVPDSASYHVTVIDPSTEWFSRVASPRGITGEDRLSINKFIHPLADAVKEYPKEKISILQGWATSLDTTARSIKVKTATGDEQTISYYALVIATGAHSHSPVLGVQDQGTETSKRAIEAFRKELPSKKNIVIVGGGPTGVEVAGEIGETLNGAAGFLQSAPSNPKAKVTLLTSDSRLLPQLNAARGKKAEAFLKRVGVEVKYNARVQTTSPELAGRLDQDGGFSTLFAPTTLSLANGETLTADLYIPAYGLVPNGSWLPANLTDERHKVVTEKTLRVPAAGPRVYAIGEIGNYGVGGIMSLMTATPVLTVNIKRDILADANVSSSGTDAKAATATAGKDHEWTDKWGETCLVPVGSAKGTGSMFGWNLPSLFVWLIKGRDFMTGRNPAALKGDDYKSEPKWQY